MNTKQTSGGNASRIQHSDDHRAHDEFTAEISDLLKQARGMSPAKQRLYARRIYGKAGEWKANGDTEMADAAKALAAYVMAHARKLPQPVPTSPTDHPDA